MRYVPNLIPDKVKVLPDYFKGDVYQAKKPNKILIGLGWVFGIFFIIAGVGTLAHPALTFLFGSIGLTLLPPGHHWIEKTLKFQLKPMIKAVFIAIFWISGILLSSYYRKIDEVDVQQLKQKTEQEQKIKLASEKKEQLRQDTLNHYIHVCSEFIKANQIAEATKKLDTASLFASTSSDKERISKEWTAISAVKIFALVKSGNYVSALPELTKLISQDGNNADLLYNRAICYKNTGKIQESVDDLRAAIAIGDPDAEKLFNQINPIRKRAIGYLTLCCDGSTSSASGRGACSRHGGVCGSKGIYELSRQYGAKNKIEEDSLYTVNNNL